MDELLAAILDSAEMHGHDSSPGHEVGDLQDALELAWSHLSAAQRTETAKRFFEMNDTNWRPDAAKRLFAAAEEKHS